MSIDDIIADFELLDDWEDRYRYVIELGRALPPFPDEERTEANRVRGCASQVWVTARAEQRDGATVLRFAGDSDAHIVRGLVAIALALIMSRAGGQGESLLYGGLAAQDAAVSPRTGRSVLLDRKSKQLYSKPLLAMRYSRACCCTIPSALPNAAASESFSAETLG